MLHVAVTTTTSSVTGKGQHFGPFDDKRQSLFCGVSLLNGNIAIIFEILSVTLHQAS